VLAVAAFLTAVVAQQVLLEGVFRAARCYAPAAGLLEHIAIGLGLSVVSAALVSVMPKSRAEVTGSTIALGLLLAWTGILIWFFADPGFPEAAAILASCGRSIAEVAGVLTLVGLPAYLVGAGLLLNALKLRRWLQWTLLALACAIAVAIFVYSIAAAQPVPTV
jgi:hypothetical protein